MVGCGKKSEEINMGAILPLTGEGAKYGQSAKNSIEMVFSKLNDDGGIKGKKINVIFEDSKGDASTGVSAAQKLISVSQVPAIIGGLFSSVTLAIAPIVERNHVVLLSPTSSAPSITNAGDYVFRNCASDVFEGKIMADMCIRKFHFNNIAILYINNDYGVGISEVFKKELSSLGGKVTIEESFPQQATDFRTIISKLRGKKYDAIYLIGYKELGPLLKQMYELGIKTQFLSTVMFEDPEILKIAGKAANGVIYSARAYDPNSDIPVVQEFVNSYKKKYGTEPDIFAAYSYDAARIIILAMQQGGFNSEGIKESLYKIKDFPGVTGTTSFDKNGDVVQAAYLKEVKNNKFIWLNK